MKANRILFNGMPAKSMYIDKPGRWSEVLEAFGFTFKSETTDHSTGSTLLRYTVNFRDVFSTSICPRIKPYLVVLDVDPSFILCYTVQEYQERMKPYEDSMKNFFSSYSCGSLYIHQTLGDCVPVLRCTAGATSYSSYSKLNIKKIIVNDPAVIVFFEDGEKIVLKRREGDQFDLDDAISIALCQKMFGKAGYRKRLKKAKKNIYIQYLGPVERLLKTIKEIGDLDHAD